MKKILLFILFLLTPFIVFAYPKGDVNGDNKVDIMDYQKIRSHIIWVYYSKGDKTKLLTGDALKRADVNGKNGVDNGDYADVRKIILSNTSSTITSTPATKPTSTPKSSPTPITNVSVTSVKFNKETMSIEIGKSNTLAININPSNATNKKVTWSSSNSNIVIVDTNGKITGKAKGEATITVTTTDGEKKATCKVIVLQPVDLVLMWGQSNMVGRAGKESELKLSINKDALLKAGLDKDIVNNTKSYGRVELSMKKSMAYEYKALSNKMVDISTNPKTFGEKLRYTNGKFVKTDLMTNADGTLNLQASTGTNMVPYFAKEYTEQTNHKLVVVHAAHGGINISKFMPSANNNMYKSMVTKYQMAESYLKKNYYTIVNRFYVVYQGETDCHSGNASKYEVRYLDVHKNLTKDLGLSFGAMVYMARGTYTCDNVYLKTVRSQQKSIVKGNSNIIMGTDFPYNQQCIKKSMVIFGGPGNKIHLNAAGLSQTGRDVAKHIVASKKIR